MAYDGFDNPVEHVGPTGISPESTYNSRHLLTGQVETSGTGSSRSRSWSYDGRGLPTGEVSFAGRELGYEHDAAGNRTAQTTGEQNTTRWSHDASGRVVSETDPRGDGHSTTFVYDDGDLVTETTDAVGATTGFGYDAVGDLVEQTDPDGATTTYEWDAAGRRVSMLRQGWEQAESWTYYAGFDGQVGVYTDATGAVMRWAYDAADRLMSMRMPRGSVSGADPAAHRWRYGYDEAGNRTRVRDPDGYLTVTGYDAVNRPVTETDPDGGVTTYRYNRAGQVNRITDPAGNHRLIQRNSLLQVDRITDARGNTTRQSRDADDLVTAEVTPLGFRTSYRYDGEGRTVAMVEARGAFFDDPDSYTWTYGYDPVGNPVLNRRYPDGTTITATFDQDSRQTTSTRTTDTGMTGDPVRFYYHANSVLARIRYPSNSGDRDELRRIDEAGRLALVANEDPDGGNRISGYAVTRDPAGNPTAVDITGSHAETGTRTYTYDQADRLVAECHATDCDTADTAIEYSYDAVGNRLTSARTGELPGPGVTTYDYDAADQLTETTTTNGDTTTSYGFDADGNLTTAGDLTYTHDVLNRERTRTGPDGTWTTTWDPDSRRMTLYETGTSDSQAFFWDINHPDNLPRLAVQADADNAGRRTWSYQTDGTALDTTTGTIGAELTDLLQTDGDTVGDDRPAAPEIPESDALAIEQAAWLHHDHRGSITDTTDIGTGEPLNRYDYEPFGTRDTIGSDGFDPLLGYTGEYHDPTGNIHLRARQHDPDLGRFTTTDPATHPTDKPFTNTYHYAANNPLIYIDPDGMRESYDGTHTSSSAESQYNIALRLTRTWMTENSEVVYGLGPRLRRGAFPPARYLEWYHKVKPGGEWDYKEYFMETFKESNYDEHMYQIRDCDWLIGMEIFGNIHYGYVGKKWAFLEAELTFAGERVGTGPDAHDRIAMEIGYDLANRYAPHELTEEVIHQEILRRLPDFAAVEPGDLQARRRDPGER